MRKTRGKKLAKNKWSKRIVGKLVETQLVENKLSKLKGRTLTEKKLAENKWSKRIGGNSSKSNSSKATCRKYWTKNSSESN